MKTITLFLLAIGIMSCEPQEASNINISVMEDITERDFKLSPSSESILPLYDFNNDMWKGAKFRYSVLSSINFNEQYNCSLPSETSLLGNEPQRKHLVKSFKNNVRFILDSSQHQNTESYSAIWEPIVKEMKSLQGKEISYTLYIYSDLLENSSWFSFYRKKDQRKLENRPKEIVELYLNKANGIKKHSHLKVIVMYQPRSVKEDADYQIMVSLYQQVFDKLELPISFKTNL